jgi:TonB family protein
VIYPASYEQEKKVRKIAAISSLIIHVLLAIVISFSIVLKPKSPVLVELDWGASSGAPNQTITESETDPNKATESAQSQGSKEQSKIEVPEVKNQTGEALPPAVKEKSKTTAGVSKSKVKSEGSTIGSRRRAKAGTPGGAGKSTGYSIEWAGSGSRRLLSGRIPRYPEGTNKELPVTLQFSVLPDGSVTGIIPLFRSDELLEREAIQALQTWRFDPLPPQFEQRSQTGKITFKFVLQKE